MTRSILTTLCVIAVTSLAGAAVATPKMGDDCKACHSSNTYLPPAHPQVTNMNSQVCKTCHVATSQQDHDRTQTAARVQDRDQDREKQRDQTQTRRQVLLGGDPGANPLGTHAAARNVDPGREIELYLNRSEDGTDRHAGGHGDDDKHSHERNHSETRMAEDDDKWAYRLLLGYLYSTDIEQHQSGSHFGGGSGSGGGHDGGDHHVGGGGGSGHDAGEGDEGSFFRFGGNAAHTSYIGNDQTLTYGISLNRDVFTGMDQVRHVGRAKLDWKWKLDDGSVKVSPYLQRSVYDVSNGADRAFWALGLNANRHLSLTPTSTVSFTFRYKQRKFDGENTARGADLRLGTVYQDKLGDWGSYRFGLGLSSRKNPKHDDRRYFGQILTGGIGGALDSGAYVWLSSEIGHRGYLGADRTTGLTRYDTYLGVGLAYTDPRLKIFKTVPQLSCHVRWTDSNISAYDTTSTNCGIIFDKRF